MQAIIASLLILLFSPHAGALQNFELKGKILFSHGEKPSGTLTAVVFLEGTSFPFSRSSLVGPSGSFKFKELQQAIYRLTIYVPQGGTMERTVEVSPSLADSKGRVEREFAFAPDRDREATNTVSVNRLKIPEKAIDKYKDAEKALGEHRVDRAIELLEESVEIAPKYATAWNRLGTIAFQTQRFESAEDYFRRALECEPEAYAPLVNLGGALLVLGEIDEAYEVNKRATQERPQDALAHSQLGLTLFSMHDLDQAEKHLLRAKSLDPHHFSYPRLVLAEIYRLRENYSSVVGVLEEFLEVHPDASVSEKVRDVLEDARKEVREQSP